MLPETSPAVLTRFWDKVERKGADECWEWTAYVDEVEGGYGQFWDGTRLVKAHRFAYESTNGKIPAGQVADHTCHNDSECTDVPCAHRRCVNPNHLEATTQSINSIRGRSGDHQSSKTECSKGHPFSIQNTIHGTSQNGRPRRACRICTRASQAKYIAKRKAA